MVRRPMKSLEFHIRLFKQAQEKNDERTMDYASKRVIKIQQEILTKEKKAAQAAEKGEK